MKLLLLGGSAQQVPAILKAKELGCETVLIDYLPDNPGQFVADKWYPESTTDVEKVYEIASREGVDGILAYASDPAALPAAIVAERLELPTNPAESVRILGIKHEFRKFLQDNGFPSPKMITFSPSTPLEDILKGIKPLHFPIVMKPTDSSGSKGVTFLENTDGLQEAVRHASEYSRNGILIAEEFIQRGFPDVIGGDIFVENGKITLFGDMLCQRKNAGTGLIPIGKKFPCRLSEEQKTNLYTELQKVIDKLGIKSGELNIELIIDKNNLPHFLELGPRAGGNMIPIQLSDIYGVDLIEANVKAALGLPVELKPESSSETFLTYVLHSDAAGKFVDVEINEEIKPYIYRKVIYKKPGDEVEVFDGAGKALGIVFMKFPDYDTMNRLQSRLPELIKIKLS